MSRSRTPARATGCGAARPELYRGLGAAVVGGLVVSTVFTLFLVPALFSLVLDARETLAARLAALRPAGGGSSG